MLILCFLLVRQMGNTVPQSNDARKATKKVDIHKEEFLLEACCKRLFSEDGLTAIILEYFGVGGHAKSGPLYIQLMHTPPPNNVLQTRSNETAWNVFKNLRLLDPTYL
jgi:hypothetical protein